MNRPALLEELLITYQWTRLGLVADTRDGGQLYEDAAKNGRVTRACDASHQPPMMTVKRRVGDLGHVLTVKREPPITVGAVVMRPAVTRVFLTAGDGTDPQELPYIWREALGLWLVLATAAGPMDPRWRALLEIDWITAPDDDGPPPAVEAPAPSFMEAVA